MPDNPKPLDARCGDCGHVWTVAHLPMEVGKACRLMAAALCPKCAGAKILVAGPTMTSAGEL
jgi:hypothetical protein